MNRKYFFLTGSFLNSFLCVMFSVFFFSANAQRDTLSFFQPSKEYNQKRVNLVTYTAGGLYVTSMFGLYNLWYKQYPQEHFHFFNDFNEWNQMDKVGHAVTAYEVGTGCMYSLKWAGVGNRKAVLYGAGIGYLFQTTIEVFDGFSSEWGFSAGDMAANTIGSGILIGQQFLWDDQKIKFKFSFHQTDYEKYRPNVLGKGLQENFLKDYNGQTYWLSFSPSLFTKSNSGFPQWLCLEIGYGIDGFTGGEFNPAEVNSKPIPSFNRQRQYYLSPGIDLTKIKTRSKFLKTFAALTGIIHFPLPAMEFNSSGGSKFYWLYF